MQFMSEFIRVNLHPPNLFHLQQRNVPISIPMSALSRTDDNLPEALACQPDRLVQELQHILQYLDAGFEQVLGRGAGGS